MSVFCLMRRWLRWSAASLSATGWGFLFVVAVIAPAMTPWVQAAEPAVADVTRGAEVYRKLCASCHGAAGEGVASEYAQPLTGDKSVAELSNYIDRTMPEGEPEKCDAAMSRDVAAYLHDAFYSPIAQVRLRPPRVELTRLTTRQYQETIADLIARFRDGYESGEGTGLRARIYKAPHFQDDQLVLERVDPQVEFDFAEGPPLPEKGMKAEEFSLRWSGSIIPPETGEYEFIVRTTNGVQLWLNDEEQELIDGSVRSGTDVELREKIRLLGGRRYVLRLELFKSKKAKEQRSSIAFLWRRPHGIEELVPSRVLRPTWSSEQFVLTTPFPPDDRSVGYERGSFISPEWDQATTDAALEVAGYVLPRLDSLARTNTDDAARTEKIRRFCEQFAEYAFRRPLSEQTRQAYLTAPFDAAPASDVAVQRVILGVLKSPRFLFREIEGDPQDPFNVASILSYTLWDSLPDEELLRAAAEGQLTTREQVRSQAERMASDPRFRMKLRTFISTWIKADQLHDLAKDAELYPGFDAALIADLRTSLFLMIDTLIDEETISLERFLLDDHLWMNDRLAKFYDAPELPPGRWERVQLTPDTRAGVLTHPYLLAGFAYHGSTSPIHRGVFISRSLLGRVLKAPPVAVAPAPADLHPGLTTRERVNLQTNPEMCRSCHDMINPLGFTLEQFDAVGRLRETEQDRPIDSRGSYITTEGEEAHFSSAVELAQYLVHSRELHAAVAQQLFHTLVKQPLPAYGLQLKGQLATGLLEQGLDLRSLAVEIAVAAAMPEVPPQRTVAGTPAGPGGR